MIFKKSQFQLMIGKVILLTIFLAMAFVVVKQLYVYLAILTIAAIFQWIIIRLQKKNCIEINQFVELINNRDFSRYFDENKGSQQQRLLHKQFNEINTTFKLISLERETQYHYLQKILEMVDTGILSYNSDNGDIGWANDSFKKLLGIPYLKSIYSLEKREPKLYQSVMKLRPNDSKVLTIERNQQIIKLLVSSSAVNIDGITFKLLAFQNVSEALDQTESSAWQKLLKVMTHEIMNSVVPISSLADTLMNRLQSSEISKILLPNQLGDIELGISTIKRRSDGLLRFAESYHNLNKINSPDLKKILIRDLFGNLNSLMLATFKKKNIKFDLILHDPALTLIADFNLLEQALINLLVNAIEAVKDKNNPIITLSAETHSSNRIIIKIIDNGIGINTELLDKIFIPFFSTRKSGSGVGLSLCKQIMFLHGGNITVRSVADHGSEFGLIFSDQL